MELVPIISTILLYTTGFLFVVIVISGIVRKVFVVKTEEQPKITPSKVVTKVKKSPHTKHSEKKLKEEKVNKKPDVKNKYRLTSVGEEYKGKNRKNRSEKTREDKEENHKSYKRFVVLNENRKANNNFYSSKIDYNNYGENKINYGKD